MDSKLSTGISPYQYHNKYPEDWAKLNSELLGMQKKEKKRLNS